MSHGILWHKLINYGVDGKFLNIIKSMYSKVKSCVKSNQGLTDSFIYKKGLRLLFVLFLNDLNTFLLNDTSGITVWE